MTQFLSMRSVTRSFLYQHSTRLMVMTLAAALSGCIQMGNAVGNIEPEKSGAGLMTITCSNCRLEIQCDTRGCRVEDSESATPMEVTLDDSGSYSACAYSGCWEGQAEVLKTETHLILHATQAPFFSGGSSTDGKPMVVSVDLTDDIAVLKVGPFAQPLQCRRPRPLGLAVSQTGNRVA